MLYPFEIHVIFDKEKRCVLYSIVDDGDSFALSVIKKKTFEDEHPARPSSHVNTLLTHSVVSKHAHTERQQAFVSILSSNI